MKLVRFSLVAVMALLGGAVFAQSKTDSIKVSGNCGMCESRIEKAMKIPGVTSADWDVKSKMLTVSYAADQISLDDIQRKIAEVGHDTPKFKATEEVYSKLPGCCKYDRKDQPSKQPDSARKH